MFFGSEQVNVVTRADKENAHIGVRNSEHRCSLADTHPWLDAIDYGPFNSFKNCKLIVIPGEPIAYQTTFLEIGND